LNSLSGAFAYYVVTTSLVISIGLWRAARLPTDGFLWNFILEVFTEIWPHFDIG
jgi:hypothetical protein